MSGINIVRSEMVARISALKAYLVYLAKLQSDYGNNDAIKAAKGSFFVLNYGIYENLIVEAVRCLVAEINLRSLEFRKLRTPTLSFVLSPELDGIAGTSRQRAWEKRLNIIEKGRSNTPVQIDESLFPYDDSHFRHDQLKLIWNVFGLAAPELPHPGFIQYIDEMVDNRNRIAHGRESPVSVGGRFSIGDIETKTNQNEQLCSHIASQFADFLTASDCFVSAAPLELSP